MKKMNYRPYGLNVDYEMKTFKYIGKDYQPMKIFKIIYKFRKRKNKKEKLYKVCNKYSDWEIHVKTTLPTHIENYEDFLHWLSQKLECCELFYENMKIILIPIYIAIIPPLFEVTDKLKINVNSLICAIVIVVVSVVFLSAKKRKVLFWKNYIDIATKN